MPRRHYFRRTSRRRIRHHRRAASPRPKTFLGKIQSALMGAARRPLSRVVAPAFAIAGVSTVALTPAAGSGYSAVQQMLGAVENLRAKNYHEAAANLADIPQGIKAGAVAAIPELLIATGAALGGRWLKL